MKKKKIKKISIVHFRIRVIAFLGRLQKAQSRLITMRSIKINKTAVRLH